MLDQILEKWPEILQSVRDEKHMLDASYRTWLEPLRPISLKGNTLTLLWPGSEYHADFVSRRYGIFLQVAIEEAVGKSFALEFVTSSEEAAKPVAGASPTASAFVTNNLNPRYTFDNFVVGKSNEMAHAAALAVAESPGSSYNPLYIYGGSGLGKTHLLQSIANFAVRENPASRIIYVTCEQFMNELIESIRNRANNAASEFREKYRNADILLIDDIQFISRREATQEELFHTFNDLYSAKKQIVLSSDRVPRDINDLEDRLRSRFAWGLMVDISLPDYETRMAILRKKEEMEGVSIDNEVIKYIAANVKSNIRDLEGALTRVIAMSNISCTPVTLEMAESALRDIVQPDQPSEITIPYILDVVAEHYGVKAADIKSARREAEIVLPRHVTMYLCRELTNTPLEVIGHFLGGRDHSTVIHGCRKIASALQTDDQLRGTVETLKKKLNASASAG